MALGYLSAFLLLLFLFNSTYGASLFTGTDKLRRLSQFEDINLKDLERIAGKMENRINSLRLVLASMKSAVSSGGAHPQDIAGHPVEAMHLLTRWRRLQELDANDFNSVEKDLELLQQRFRRRGTGVPTLTDYDGAADGLLRLQKTYALATEDLTKGEIKGFQSLHPLGCRDRMHIGLRALVLREYDYVTGWLTPLLGDDCILSSEEKFEVVSAIANAHMEIGTFQKGKEIIEENYNLTSDFMRTSENILVNAECLDDHGKCKQWAETGECDRNPKYMLQSCQLSCSVCRPLNETHPKHFDLRSTYHTLVGNFERHKDKAEEIINHKAEFRARQRFTWSESYEQLCRGDIQENDHTLLCRFRETDIPFVTYKEEILSWEPRIAIVYDVITNQEANIITIMSQRLMTRGQVGGSRDHSNVRISNVGWLDDHNRFVKQLTRRVELITGLTASLKQYLQGQVFTSSDAFQVVNYGIGGHYEPHLDYFENADKIQNDIGDTIRRSGDRIATFLIYLSNVTAGGSTVFPRKQVAVPPIKNAAAFWFNCKRSGEYDPMTLHAGCPVLLGEKWVSNKWIREHGNQFNDKCGLHIKERRT